MSAVQAMPAMSGADLSRAVLDQLRSDGGVRDLFGIPPRVHDGEPGAPAFPFAQLESVQETDAGSAGVPGRDYRITISTASRHGGRSFAMELVGTLRAALETMDLQVPGQRIVLQQVVYADALRSADRRRFRGLVRVRIITEEEA